MTMDEKLAKAREAIDRIDGDIHALLHAREREVEKVNSAKQLSELTHRPAYRPFREAIMMARLAKAHKQAFPFKSTEHIWREIIAGFTQLQKTYAVYLFNSDLSVMDMARFHFGFATQLVPDNNLERLIDHFRQATPDLLLWPLACDVNHLYRLISGTGLRIVNRLPTFAGHDFPQCLVLAVCEPETGPGAVNYYWVMCGGEEFLWPDALVTVCSERSKPLFSRSSWPLNRLIPLKKRSAILVEFVAHSEAEQAFLAHYGSKPVWLGRAPARL